MKHAASSLALAFALGLSAAKSAEPPNPGNPVSTHTHTHTNRLSREKSPYLLQHQHNPVDWYAWGDEAFTRAAKENKPIFLSIGYSTCHWCHVMERESFENEEFAKYLNEHFIPIKVDREERPDVDKIYMSFVQATSGQGGWPLNVFLTPDLKPFFGGTYFPPDNRHGRPGFLQLLQNIEHMWETRHADLTNSAQQIHERLSEAAEAGNTVSNILLSAETLRHAGKLFKSTYDAHNGGFGGAPKFPQPSQPIFLLEYGRRFKDDEAIKMVLHTCDKMAAGGIHDQIGGGFARYSVDAEWLVPHFEKMLYDNAQLTQLYLDAYLISGEDRYADVARDILAYILRDMTNPEGGFYSAEDADSEGQEGKFYCWTKSDLAALLTPEEFKLAAHYFGITEKGNFVDHSHPNPLPNLNVLSIVEPKVPIGNRPLLASAKAKMFAARSKRIRPHLDDKILVSWNGLMLGAMARSFSVLGDETYRAAARKNLHFLQSKLWDEKTKTLHHRWRDGERDNVQLLEGYAFLLSGVIDYYEANLEPASLEFAIALANTMVERFYDSENGGFWQSPAGMKDLILRTKEDYDGAEPSGNSVAVKALLKLGKITDNHVFTDAAEKTLRLFANRLQQLPQAVPCMLQALEFSLEEPRRAVLAGDPASGEGAKLLQAIHSVFQPLKVVLGNRGPVEEFAKTLPGTNSPQVYICTGTACQPPTSLPAKVKDLMR